MVGQAFRVLAQPISTECLDGVHNLRVQGAPSLVKEAALRHLVRQGVLEGVFKARVQAGFVQELRSLQVVQAATQCLLALLCNGLEECKGEVLADNRRSLQEPLLLGRQPVDTGRQDRLNRGGHLDHLDRVCEAVGTPLAEEGLRLDQGPHAFFEKEAVPSGLRRQETLERAQGGVGTEQGIEQLRGALRRERIQAELQVIGLSPPRCGCTRAGS